MLQSQLFGKTSKNIKENLSLNAALLQRAGFIDQEMAGVYAYLTLGLRVLRKIEQIIREEMDLIGSEVMLPSIVPFQIWEQSGRLEKVDVLMKTSPANAAAKAKNDAEYILNSTHEDTVTPIAQKFNKSYKDFPFALYQINTKFRNEPRAKSGLLRCREFRMKDLYSFHTSEADMKKYYEVAKEAYWKVFDRLGLKGDTFIAMASGGDFTEDYSHEFQTVCDAGEDIIFHAKKAGMTFNREVAPSQAPVYDTSKNEMKPMEEVKGEGIIGVEALAKFLNISVEDTTKTILFETEKGDVVAVAVRGTYEINEEKVRKIIKCKTLQLARPEVVKKVTGADIGYAGILNLPKEVTILMDESMKNRRNFECGANKTNYHSINVNFGRDILEPEQFYDLKTARDGDFYPENGEKYELYKVAEVGNIFPLNTKFTKAFGYTYIDEAGKEQPIYMGSYGIGPSRIMGVLVEKFHDERGIIWPEQVAPFTVHLIGIDLKDDTIKHRANEVYQLLTAKKIEVLFDDRIDTGAGGKFADADLIGIPHRIVVSKRTGDQIEYKKRSEKESTLVSVEELYKILGV